MRLSSPAAGLIRSRLTQRRAELDEHDPEALDLAAEVLAAMHAAAWGRMAELRDSRTARYREAQISGEHGLPLEDLAYLALEAPDVAAALLEPIAAAAGYRLEPLPEATASLGRQAADLSRSGGELAGVVTESVEDGVVDAVELDQIRRRMADHRRALAGLEATVARLQLEPEERRRS